MKLIGELQLRRNIIHGKLFLIVTQNGQVKQVREVPNLYVQQGRDLMASAMGQSGGSPGAQWMALATGQSVASDDTTLTGEYAQAPSRIKACYSHVAGSGNWTLKATWAGLFSSATFFQAGVLASATGGALFAKASFDSLVVASQDTLTMRWTFSISMP